MKPKVYLETTVVSYLTARLHRDIVVAAHQQLTRDWWETARDRFDVVASALVISEASMGDVVAARERLEVLNQLPLLEIHENARELARHFVAAGVIPANVEEDALHLAIAATNGVHYLVTWNCKHLANVTMRPTIEHACRSWGYQPPVICTPELLLDNS